MVPFRGLIQNFRRASPPLSYAESPRVLNKRRNTKKTEKKNFRIHLLSILKFVLVTYERNVQLVIRTIRITEKYYSQLSLNGRLPKTDT